MNNRLLSFIHFGNKSFSLTKYKIEDENLPKEFNNFKIVHLSDFHNSFAIKDIIIRSINEESPDIVIMTGDMVNKYDTKSDFYIFLDLARSISDKYKTYFICGNHENRLDKEDLAYILKKLKEYNIFILNNKNKKIYVNKEYINLCGINLSNKCYITKNIKSKYVVKNEVNRFLKNMRKSQYNILLAHNPLIFEEYAKYNVNLIFSGHVHGGMIRLPIIGAILSPERKFFPKYNNGIYRVKDKIMIVSRGLGHSRPGIRIKNKPELISITLYYKK